jgi:hypothetical protein
MFRFRGVNIWDHEMPIRFGGIPLWHRMTVIRLTNGGLVVHSPTTLDLTSQKEFQKLGTIVAIIAPSWWHDLYLREYLNAYPDARLYGNKALCQQLCHEGPFGAHLANFRNLSIAVKS